MSFHSVPPPSLSSPSPSFPPREPGDEYKLKLSDVNLALGEVGLESDQYQQAVEDLQSSLRLREFALEPTDRRIAEV